MRKLLSPIIISLLLLTLPTAHSASTTQSDCLPTLMKLSSCMAFVMNGSNQTAPDTLCCQGLQSIIDTDATAGTHDGVACLCSALNSGGASYGVQVNRTKSLSISDACSVPANNCTSAPPASSPAPVFHPIPSPPNRSAPANSTSGAGGSDSSWLTALASTAVVLLFRINNIH